MEEPDRELHSAGEHELAAEVSERIRAIISSAEAAASAVRHEAEQRAQVKRRLADEEARRIVEDARRDAEAFLAERIRRISELSDAVVERGEGIVMRLERAEEVRRQLQGLADALGESAEELARELGGEAPERRSHPKPPPLRPPTDVERPGARSATAGPAASAGASPEADASTPDAEVPPVAEVTRAGDAPAAADLSPAGGSAEPVDAEIADDPTVGELASDVADDDSGDAPVVPVELVPEEPEPRERSRAREPDDQLSARLVALQMAVAGGKRDEVATHLRRTFDLDDVTQILDDVFGSGEDGEKAGWPSGGGAA